MIAATGWTWEYMDEWMTIPRLERLLEHWAKYPPVHVTAALFTGVTSERAAARAEAANESSMEKATALVRNLPADPRNLQWQAVR